MAVLRGLNLLAHCFLLVLLVVGALPDVAETEQGTIYLEIKDISLHVAMAGTVPSIPPSVALKYSELMITNRELTQQQNELSLVVPPSTRAIYAFSRQLIHDVRADAERTLDQVDCIANAITS